MRKDINRQAMEGLEKYEILKKMEQYGYPVFLVVTGSDSFGFPSKNSDIDIRGVYQAPSERFLGLRKTPAEPTMIYMSNDRMIDVSIEEIGKYLDLVSKSNPERLEWVNLKPFWRTNEHKNLKEIVNSCSISKGLHLPYQQFAQKAKVNGGVKKALYGLRTYMTGITILEGGGVVRDIRELNKRFGEGIVDKLIEQKKQGELIEISKEDEEKIRETIERLDKRLGQAVVDSDLPEGPNTKRINDYLTGIRLDQLKKKILHGSKK